MILCLDIGNSHIYGGVFDGDDLRLTFRKASKTGASSDEYGLFFRSVLRENDLDPAAIEGLIEQRRQAREAKDFAASDRIRDDLAAQGVVLEDGADGTTWRRGG